MHARRPTSVCTASISLAALLLGGCASKDTILPQDGPTMRQVYDAHFEKQGYPAGGSGAIEWVRPLTAGDGHLAGYTRDANNEIRAVFPVLPNPTLVMYVYPHLTAQGHPVPGYATAFGMYEKHEYALPGEAEGW